MGVLISKTEVYISTGYFLSCINKSHAFENTAFTYSIHQNLNKFIIKGKNLHEQVW